MSVITVTNSNFESEVLKSSKPTLVDFWASWCGPCRALSPVVDEIAGENPQYKVCKINVDEQPELAARFGIMSIPTLLIFNNGSVVGKSVGVRPKQDILNLLSQSKSL